MPSPASQRIIETLLSIPRGRVLSYGRVAELSGMKGGARQVVRILHVYAVKLNLPWHRVIRADGYIALPEEAGRAWQAELLRVEGIVVNPGGRVDIKRFTWLPDA